MLPARCRLVPTRRLPPPPFIERRRSCRNSGSAHRALRLSEILSFHATSCSSDIVALRRWIVPASCARRIAETVLLRYSGSAHLALTDAEILSRRSSECEPLTIDVRRNSPLAHLAFIATDSLRRVSSDVV